MPVETFLVEEMLIGGVAELLIGVVKDPAHGFVLTLGAGGTLTELLTDSASMLIPATRDNIDAGLQSLKSAKLLNGFRGTPTANIPAVIDAITAIQSYVLANADGLEEIEVNPLICTPNDAIAADALIRRDT
jgi:succinyl-CoA synthetase beta subunit